VSPAKGIAALFAVIVLGFFAMYELAEYRLAHTRYTEHLAIVASTPGYSVSTAENDVAERFEEALSQVQGIESIRSEVRSGSVTVNADVTAIGVDARHPVELVHEALEKVLPELPRELGPPTVMRVDEDSTTRFFIARSDRMTRVEVTRWLDEVFRRTIEVKSGVREIRLCGDMDPELKITLDPDKLRAFALDPSAVLSAIRDLNSQIPGGQFAPRLEKGRLEDLQMLELRGGQIRLRDVARLEVGAEAGPCTTAKDILVTVRAMPEAEFGVPSHPEIKVTPFTPKRIARLISAPGVSVEKALHTLSSQYPNAMITAEGNELTVMFPEEPPRMSDVPELALRSLDDRHSVVRVQGPDFEQLVTLGGKARELLAKTNAKWVGTPWPSFAPEQVLKPMRGEAGIAQLLQLAIGGVKVGRLEDGTEIRVMSPSRPIEDLQLADGRRASEVMEITNTTSPSAMLRVNRVRTVELDVGMDPSAARSALKNLQLPQGYAVNVTER
jgi:multidrug efflux pump subunit AcrB